MVFETFALTGAVTGYLLAASPGGWCAPQRQPYINVRTEKWQPGVDLTKKSSELQNFKIDTVNPYGPGVASKVGGLTKANIEVKQSVSVTGARLGRSHCLWFDRIEITVALKPIIYVAREYPKGQCRFASIWNHELKHVEVDKRLLDRYRYKYDVAVKNVVSSQPVVGPFTNATDQQVQAQMVERIRKVTEEITAQMKSERDRLQQSVDTLAEYERVRKQCP